MLAKEGGALGKMIPVFQMFAGGPLGSGRQWMSWCAVPRATAAVDAVAAQASLWRTLSLLPISISLDAHLPACRIHRDDVVRLLLEAIRNPE